MKFTINSKQFLSTLSAVGRVVPAKSAIQILSEFLIEVKDQEVAITASDTENQATAVLQAADTEGQGAFCIDAKFLINIFRSLPDCAATIVVTEKGDVSIKTDRNDFNAVSHDASQYPQSNFSETPTAVFQISTESLLAGLAETSFAIGTDDFHPQMMGVCFDVKSDKAVFVATDTRQLVKSEQAIQAKTEARCILSTKAMSAVSALAAKDASVSVAVYPTAVEFSGASFILRCQLIKGNYPEYNRVIPQGNNYVVTFNRTELISAIRRVSACADSSYGALKFAFDDNQVVITSNDSAFNRSAKEIVECDSNEVRMVVGLSASLLQGLLSVLSSELVQLRLSDSSRPVVIKPVGDDHITTILMPMRVEQ